MIRLFKTHKIRKQIELDGLWEFTVQTVKAIPENYEYTLPVPGCWEMHPEFLTYRGKAAYRKTIILEQKTSLRLEFKGVSHTAEVYFDGRPIGNHYNAYTPFSMIINDAEKGEHEIVVLVDNSFSEQSALHIGNDYYTYGGIIRPVVVEEVKDLYIDRIEFIPSCEQGLWKAAIKVFLKNITEKEKEVVLKAQLNDVELDFGIVNIEGNGLVSISKSFVFDGIEEWSQHNPKLYLLEAVIFEKDCDIPCDDLIERVGFRTVNIDGHQLNVNEEAVLLMGFNRHEDHANIGCSLPLQLMVKDIELVKASGANAIRTCHYPNDELFLDLCDEKGLYVWEENHARGLSLEQMNNPNFETQCEQCNIEMVQNHINHPSIVVWGILNECASDVAEGKEMYKRQFDQIRLMDQSRPLTSASNRPFTDICLDLVDIVSANLYAGWYHDDDVGEFFEKFSTWVDENGGKGKPVIISEFGAAAIYGFREPTRVKWSEERQSDILDACLCVYLNRTRIAGAFVWQLADCRVTEENDWFKTRARTKNNKGVMDEYRRPKQAFDTVKRHFMMKCGK